MACMTSGWRRGAAALGVVGVGSLLGACARTSVARAAFSLDYACPADEVEAGPAASRAGSARVRVKGCGHEAEYDCSFIAGYPIETADDVACTERARLAFVATDGSLHEAWITDAEAAAKEAALVSAAHDLGCGRGDLTAVAPGVVEGCGRRVRYEITDHDVAGAKETVVHTFGRRFRLRLADPAARAAPGAG